MDVYVHPTGRCIEPFGDAAGDSLILERPLSSWLDDAIREAGGNRIDERRAPCLVVPDNLFATGSALRAFADAAGGRNAVLVLGRSKFGELATRVAPDITDVDAGWRFESVRFESGGDEPFADVVIDPEERLFELDVPRGYRTSDDPMEVGVPRHPVATMHHWAHIVYLNQIARGIELRRVPRWRLVLRGLGAVARARSVNKWKVLGKLNQIGKNCDIHPTALVEASVLGDGVRVGPFARVSFSHVGDGAELMAQCNVEGSTIGAAATVCSQTVLRGCTLYPEAVAAQYLMQQCVLGRRALTNGGAFTLDFNFEQEVRVVLDGTLWRWGTRFLGAAFGHRSRIGTGFYLASGRAVPNDYQLIRDPTRVLSKLPAGLDNRGPLIADRRELVPLAPPAGPPARAATGS